MSTASTLGTLFAFLAVGGVALVILKAKLAAKSGTEGEKFKAKDLFTPNELEFLVRLETAAPEIRFHGQVSMGAILEPTASKKDGKAFYSARGQFAQKQIDFVAQDRKTGRIVAIIELDDRTHSAEKDAKRDAMLNGAGYRTIRWNSKNKPDTAAIRAQLFPVSTPQPNTVATPKP